MLVELGCLSECNCIMKGHIYLILWFAVMNYGQGSTVTPMIPTTISNLGEPTENFNDTTLEDYFLDSLEETYMEQKLEDEKIINETLDKFGPLHDFNMLGLPGPEIAIDEERFNYTNIFEPLENGTFRLRLRTVTDNFSYNSRYEEGTITKEKGVEIPQVKGQFGEHIEGKIGDYYYIRTIGYIVDENGYRQFLLDLTKAEITDIVFSSEIGGPSGEKDSISSTVLGTLIGGNLG